MATTIWRTVTARGSRCESIKRNQRVIGWGSIMAFAKNKSLRGLFGALAVCAVPIGWAAAEAPGGTPQDTQAKQGVLEEIIVTAQKRPERLQDVPATVTAVNSDQLEGFHITN